MNEAAAQIELSNTIRDMENTPTGEPIVAQIDNVILQTVLDRCVKYGTREISLPNGQVATQQYIEKYIYPDIYDYVLLLSHLERTTFFTEKQARMAWRQSKLLFTMSKAKYRNDKTAINLLNKLKILRYTVIFGDGERGRKQDYVAKISGSSRSLTVGGPQRGRSIIERISGR